MDEPHKIVVILGNGFDLDLGLKTSYKHFWESDFCPKDYPAPIIKHLNQCWPGSLDAVKWYDLENELLMYAIKGDKKDVVSAQERNYILSNDDSTLYTRINYYGSDDIMSSLVEKGYMKIDRGSTYRVTIPYKEDYSMTAQWRDQKALQHIKDGLCNYLVSLQYEREAKDTIAYQVLQFLSIEADGKSSVAIYSFNYTDAKDFVNAAQNAKIQYMHGNCRDGGIIIGTRDDSEFVPSYDFLQKSFDPSFNPPALVADLQEADEVIIFGHSIGDNDRQYFKAFFLHQTDFANTRRKDITIFTRDEESERQIKRAMESMTDWNLSTLFGLNNLQIIKTCDIKDDQKKLYDFLVKHGKEDFRTREFIGKLLCNKSKE